jgi:uncharacterized protein
MAESPCTGQCHLDERLVCTGCHRTLREIKQWTSYSPSEVQWIMQSLPSRRLDSTSNHESGEGDRD